MANELKLKHPPANVIQWAKIFNMVFYFSQNVVDLVLYIKMNTINKVDKYPLNGIVTTVE
jgi:hypothetical protein